MRVPLGLLLPGITALVLNPQIALGLPEEGPQIALHLKSLSAKVCGAEAPRDLPCSQFDTSGKTGRSYSAYVVVANADVAKGISGTTFGIHYNHEDGKGVDVFGWTFCTGGLQFPGPLWPRAGSGNAITWSDCVDQALTEFEDEGVHAAVGAFYSVRLRALLTPTPHPDPGKWS